MATSRDDLILVGDFLLLSKKKTLHHVTLTRSSLFFHPVLNNRTTYEEKFVQICDIVGCHLIEQQNGNKESGTKTAASTGKTDSDSTCLDQAINNCKNNEGTSSPTRSFPRGTDVSSCGFIVFAYPFRKKLFSSKKIRGRQELTFEVVSDGMQILDERRKLAEIWRNVINCLCRDVPVNLNDIPSCVPPPRERMLLLINPHSGPGRAYTIFKNEIAPMLNEACIPFKAIVTEHAGHAGDLMKTIKLSEWYGVVVISGDGLIFETINGIMQRDDWASSIKFPIGCLPGGSGNALCCSINYAAGEPLDSSLVLHSTFILMKHRVIPMDLVVVHIPNRTIFSFLSVTWGIVADIDFESEKYRKLGEARFTVGAIRRIIGLRSYRGRISFLPIAEYSPKVTATVNKVLTKVRRFSLQSRSSSKSTLNSLDSKNGSSDLNNGIYKKTIDLSEPQVCLDENSAVDSFYKGDLKNAAEASGSIDNFCDNPHQGDYASKSICVEGSNYAISVEHENIAITAGLCHDGGGDAKATNVLQQNSSEPGENGNLNSVFPHQNSNSADSSQVSNNSALAQNTFVNRNNEYCSTSEDTQRNNDNMRTSSNGCSIESNHKMTILSDTKEVRVEQETYIVTKADHAPVPTPLLVPLDQDVPSNWVILDANFVLAIAIYQTHLGSDMFAAPDAHLSDGHIHLMMVREGITRNALLNLFLTFDQGQHINSPHVDVVKVLAFRFEPASKDGNIMVDGERFDPTPIQGQILPDLARIMAIK